MSTTEHEAGTQTPAPESEVGSAEAEAAAGARPASEARSAETDARAAEAERRSLESGVPPAGEEIHLPGQSALPIITAVGITLSVIGTTIDWKIWSTMGVAITLVCVVLWIRSTKRQVEALPEEHSH